MRMRNSSPVILPSITQGRAKRRRASEFRRVIAGLNTCIKFIKNSWLLLIVGSAREARSDLAQNLKGFLQF
jgi:hypothetical protein